YLAPRDGAWAPVRDEDHPERERRTAFSCHKFGAFGKDAPPTHAAAIKAEIVRAVSAWAAENPDVLRQAERAHLSNELGRVEAEAAELAGKLREAEEKCSTFADRLAEVS